MRVLTPLAVGLLLVPALAGCLQGLSPASVEPPLDPVRDLLRLLDDGGVEVAVPVPVLLVGFEPGTAAAVQERLPPETLEHAYLDYVLGFPPDTAERDFLVRMPILPTAEWRVAEATPELADEIFAAMAASRREGADDVFETTTFEDALPDILARHGHALRAETPSFLVLHAEAGGFEDHAWRYTMPNGWLEPVRVFGEREPVLVFDVSAREDPYVTSASGGPLPVLPVMPRSVRPYDRPIAAGGDEVVEALEELVRDATDIRLLHGAIYPVTTAPCHAVTHLYVIREAALTEKLPFTPKASDFYDEAGLLSAYRNLTGAENVHVDTKLIVIPREDPVLDAMIPRHIGQLDMFRWWINENFDKYWVAHEGCEPYLSVLVYGDAAEGAGLGFGGIATYDTEKTRRISFSVTSDLPRLRATWEGPAKEVISSKPGNAYRYDAVMRLYSHETGHLMGIPHPHNAIKIENGWSSPSFSSVWTTMSYQARWLLNDFGAIDQANFARNRAGFAVADARALGLEGTPEFEDALRHLEMHHWTLAGDILVAEIAKARAE